MTIPEFEIPIWVCWIVGILLGTTAYVTIGFVVASLVCRLLYDKDYSTCGYRDIIDTVNLSGVLWPIVGTGILVYYTCRYTIFLPGLLLFKYLTTKD